MAFPTGAEVLYRGQQGVVMPLPDDASDGEYEGMTRVRFADGSIERVADCEVYPVLAAECI